MATTEQIGRYHVKSELGRGGMATVFLAHDPLIGRDVAVKVLPREFLHDPSFRGRFEREARTIAMLEHPSIVPIYDFGEQDGQPYLVMRYMKGGSLADRLRNGPLPLPEVAEILERLGSALDHAHNRGVIHRDLKPGNILFDEYRHAFLSDFGIVKLAQATATFTGGSIIGTPAYMSPEQVHGDKEIDGRSDIYTLGVILFEMLTGRMPFEADTPAKLMMAHVLKPIPRIRDVRPDLPPQYDPIISKALSKEPDSRFHTASDLSHAVRDTLTGQTVAPATASQHTRPPGTLPQQPASTAQGEVPRHTPATPPVPTPAEPRTPTGPQASGEETDSGRSRLTIAALALVGLLVLCCGGFFVFSYLGDNFNLLPGELDLTDEAQLISDDEATALAAGTVESQAIGNVTPPAGDTPAPAVDSAATGTAQAVAIATRVAESTATSQARTDATEAAYAPTREVEVAVQAILTARQNEPLFGPGQGSLVHVSDGFVKATYAGVSVRDFVVDAVFYNPYSVSDGSWDIGFAFRENDINDQYRLAVESNGNWSLSDRQGENTTYISEGRLDNLNRGASQANRITLYAQGDTGYLFVNAGFVAQLDLSSRNTAGDIAVATSIFAGNEIEGEETAYEEFTIWPAN